MSAESSASPPLLRVDDASNCRLKRGYWGFSSPRLDQVVNNIVQRITTQPQPQPDENLPADWLDHQYARDVTKHQKKKTKDAVVSDHDNDSCTSTTDNDSSSDSHGDNDNGRQQQQQQQQLLRYHVTMALGKEIKTLTPELQDSLLHSDNMMSHILFVSGVALTETCAFIVVTFPRAAQLRRRYGLPPKDFHVTIGFPAAGDDHGIAKGLESVSVPYQHPLHTFQHEWLTLVRSQFQAHRNHTHCSETMELVDLSQLCRAIVTNIAATYPNEHHLMEQWGLLWCRIAGLWAQDYKVVVQAADAVLNVRPQCAPALGYKGYALLQLQHYNHALVCLDEAHTIFQTTPVKDGNNNKSNTNKHKQQRQAHQVEDCLVRCCQALGRELPTPPLAKFPRTAHVFKPQDSLAVTPDDQVLTQDSALVQQMTQTTVLLQEKIDGSNLGFSLGYNGRDILIQNRSHYLSQGEHPQYNPITTWIDTHREALLQVLQSEHKRSSRHGLILFGEWMVARHSLPYHKLPGYFVAFDLYDIAEQRFYSQPRLHATLQGTGIPVVPTVGEYQFETTNHNSCQGNPGDIETQLLPFLETPSKFRNDGGTLEGIVFRIDDGDWNLHRGKLVRPDFVSGIDQHWATRVVEKQTVDFDYAQEYMAECYDLAPTELPARVEQTRRRFAVVYSENNSKP
eukprot:CAMPEP_0168819784 /NCGR_PEP_ID=MMETSP0726-20121227/8487_1 /TAXON_ID=265536 /ORGANISM="Amphiprora sp., Strain CCMP467" /LENGTH=678 /DNA_ID=CAMNT_0008872225 /DNA_START=35 /DNA_END=2067 /DNA_ORIENTATION=+